MEIKNKIKNSNKKYYKILNYKKIKIITIINNISNKF